MQLFKDKNKIRWNQTWKLITDPTSDFLNKILNVQFLNKKLPKSFKNLWSQMPQKYKPCSIPKSTVACGKSL